MLTSIQPKAAGTMGLLFSFAYIGAALYQGQPVSEQEWAVFGALVSAALGNLRSRQNNIPSEAVGVAPAKGK